MTDIQIVLIEADQATRVQRRAALRAQPGIEVASEATNGETGLVLLESIDVDVAVVEHALPDMALDVFIERMHELQAESYVQTSHLLVLLEQAEDGAALADLAVDGYCLKSATAEAMAAEIRAIHAGKGAIA